MKKKDPVIKTKRLILRPMSDAELAALIEKTADAELRAAYEEMLAGCKREPNKRVWHALWSMTSRETGAYIGDIDFKGAEKNHAVEIGYGVLREYEGQGYATEAVQGMTKWAFEQKNVYFVEAETAPDNAASRRVLEKCGFVPDGEGEEGPRFVLESALTNWTAIYMLLGISLGSSFGSHGNNLAFGMSLGIAVGLCLGVALDASAKKTREEARNARLAAKGKGIASIVE